jgi:hypothetical protein
MSYAAARNYDFVLYVRSDTALSKPLQEVIGANKNFRVERVNMP